MRLPIGAVSGSQNPLVGNQGSSTERSTADEKSSDPGEFIGGLVD